MILSLGQFSNRRTTFSSGRREYIKWLDEVKMEELYCMDNGQNGVIGYT